MIKYEYVVVRPFHLFKSKRGKNKIARKKSEIDISAEYKKKSQYFDYEDKAQGMQQDPVTKELYRLKYLKLVREYDNG